MARSPNYTIGIECESLEHDTWGIARMTRHALMEIARNPELQQHTNYVLYSNGPLPADPLYDTPCFVRRPLGIGSVRSFSLYYYILLPLHMMWDRLSSMYLPNYMLPWPSPVPTLVMLTDDIWHETKNPNLPVRYRIAYRIFALFFSARYATRIMSISQASQQELTKLLAIPPQRIEVNHLGTEPPTNNTPVPSTPTPRYILAVGQAFERRNTLEIIEAYTRIATTDKALSLVLVGPDRYHPPQITHAIERAQQLLGDNRIAWHKHVGQTTLNALMAHTQCIVYVSDREAFGLPPLEGLARGALPVVADAPVSREILGDLAIFVHPTHDVPALEHALTQALSDEQLKTKISHTKEAHIAQFSWKRHAVHLVNILRTISR